jgi:capsular polysaccharide transport system permease protein
MAKRISDTVMAFSEELVNQMNDRAHQDALRLTRAEVTAAEKRVLQAQAELRRFRDDKSILDPEATAKGLENVIAQLESEAAGTQAELTAALQVMQQGSPRVQTLERKLRALQDQLAREKTRLAGLNSTTTTLSSLVGDYAQLATEEEFAQKQLVHSMGAYEAARLKAISQSRYLVPIQPPTLPQESLYPRPFLFTAAGFLTLLIVVGLCSLIIAAIKDHMGV